MSTAERIARSVTVAAGAFFVALLYLHERSRFIGDAMHWTNWLALGAASLVFVLPLFPTIAIPEFPVVVRQERRLRRYRRNECPSCAHPFDPDRSERCSECGESLDETPAPFEFTFASLRRFGVLMVLAWMLGVGTAEIHARLDEFAFREEVRQAIDAGNEPTVRERWWPAADRQFTPTFSGRFIVN